MREIKFQYHFLWLCTTNISKTFSPTIVLNLQNQDTGAWTFGSQRVLFFWLKNGHLVAEFMIPKEKEKERRFKWLVQTKFLLVIIQLAKLNRSKNRLEIFNKVYFCDGNAPQNKCASDNINVQVDIEKVYWENIESIFPFSLSSLHRLVYFFTSAYTHTKKMVVVNCDLSYHIEHWRILKYDIRVKRFYQ